MTRTETLQIAGTVVALAGAMYAAAYSLIRLTIRFWRRTFGSRRLHTALLNKLACGVTYEYVLDLFGTPAYRRTDQDWEECSWRTRHGWLCGKIGEGSLWTFAFTVTDDRYRFDCDALSFEQMKVTLGKTTVGSLEPAEYQSDDFGARRYSIVRHYYYGNPGAYQRYVLTHNDAGVGGLDSSDVAVDDGEEMNRVGKDKAIVNRLVINTIAIFPPHDDHVWRTWHPPGVDLDFIRTLRH